MSDESLHDEIAAAFQAANAKTDEVDTKGVIDKLEGKDDDETEAAAGADKSATAGVDKKPAEEDEGKHADEAASTAEGSEGVKLTDSKAPSSWSPKVREKWNELPEEVRAEIIRREEASVNGVRKLQEEHAPIRQLAQDLDPFVREAQQMGVNASEYIGRVMMAERALRSQNVNQRFEALLNIADQYGIPLRQAINQSAGKEILPGQPAQQQLPPEVMRELQEARRWREQTQLSTIEQTVNVFKSGKEFYEDVRDIMADLLEAGTAKDLQDAYDKAIWIQPEVRSVLLDREKAGHNQSTLKSRQSAAAGATVKSSGAADVDVVDDSDDSTEAIIRRAMKDSAGRV